MTLLLKSWPRGVDPPKELDPRGFQLIGATVLCRLELDGVKTKTPISLQESVVKHGLTARWAELEGLDLTGPRLGPLSEGSEDAVIDASGTTFRTDLVLSFALVRGCSYQAAIVLAGTKVSGSVKLDKFAAINEQGQALHAKGLVVGGDAEFSSIEMLAAYLASDSGPALNAEGLVGDSDFRHRYPRFRPRL